MPDGFFSKLGRVAKTTGEGFFPAPQEGLFTGAETRRNRGRGLMGFGTALLSGADYGEALDAGTGSYEKATANMLAQKKAAKEQALAAARDVIGKRYAAQPGDTPATLAAKYPAMMQDYLAAGDLDAAARLEPLVNKMLGDKPSKGQFVQLGDRVGFGNTETGEIVWAADRAMLPEEAELRRLALDERRASMQYQHTMREQVMGEQARRAFISQNAKLLHTEQKWSNWKASYEEAKSGNPQAYKSAIINFVSLADPGTQIRLGMLQFASQLDPSIKGSVELWLQKAEKGEFPPHMLEGMMDHAAGLHSRAVEDYRVKYEHRIRSNPMLEAYLDPTEIAFPDSYQLPLEVAERARLKKLRGTEASTSRAKEFAPQSGKKALPAPPKPPLSKRIRDWFL